MAISHLAQTYGKLGRHAEALELQEGVVVFLSRVEPKNHLDIGEGHLRREVLHALC